MKFDVRCGVAAQVAKHCVRCGSIYQSIQTMPRNSAPLVVRDSYLPEFLVVSGLLLARRMRKVISVQTPRFLRKTQEKSPDYNIYLAQMTVG